MQKGEYLGFRRGADTWVARVTQPSDSGGYRYRYKSLDNATNYDSAKRSAEVWFAKLRGQAGTEAIRGSVREALETYVEVLREQGRNSTADNASDRFRLIVWDDPLADSKLEDLTRQAFRAWRERLRGGRQNRSVNRHVRSVVAGLNVAIKEGHIGNPEAWSLKPLADDLEGGSEVTLFLSRSQRDSIVAAASPACADFLRAIEFTGGRPGELAAAAVADFDGKGSLTLRHKKGRPATLRARAVALSSDARAFFRQMSRGKLPGAPLLRTADGAPWNRHKWADEVQEAIAEVNQRAKGRARIPAGASAYSFRHARISEMLQRGHIDPVTVAQQTGTSTRMIEQHYFQFIPSALRDKLDAMESAR